MATETRRLKIVSFSINDMTGHGYFMQLTDGADKAQIADADADAHEADKAQTWKEPQAATAMVAVKPEVLLKLLAFL